MSTRCTVRLYDQRKEAEYGPTMLYHHSDGYPDFMLPMLHEYMGAVYEHLKEAGYPYWWDQERVAAVMVLLSVEDYSVPMKPYSTKKLPGSYFYASDNKTSSKDYRPDGGVPVFHPCGALHGDLEYLYDIVLGAEGKYEIYWREYLGNDKWSERHPGDKEATQIIMDRESIYRKALYASTDSPRNYELAEAIADWYVTDPKNRKWALRKCRKGEEIIEKYRNTVTPAKEG